MHAKALGPTPIKIRPFQPRARCVGGDPHALDQLLRKRAGRGASAREIVAIARAAAASGATSSIPHNVNNAARDIIREGRRSLKADWNLWSEKTHVRRPHNRWHRARFDEVMGVGHCTDFWREVAAHNPEWFTSHPAHDDIMKEPHLHIPVRLFGDDGGLGKSRQLNVLHWTSIVTAAHGTGQCKIPLMVQADATAIYDLTFQPLHSVIAWSFNCALTGLHPRRGPTRKRFEDRQRRRLGGQQLAGGFKLVYVMFVSDWKAEVEVFHLEHHYNKGDLMCHLCWATKDGELSYCKPCNNPCFDHPRRNDDYMASRSAAMSPLTAIVGFHILQVLPDGMHVGPLGIFLIVAGSVLWELCQEGCFGPLRQAPRWQDDLSMRLKQAYSEFCVFFRRKGMSCSQRVFTPGRLSMTTLQSAPALKAKAANAIVIVEWLADYCARQAAAAPDIDYYSERATMLWGLTSIFRIWRASPRGFRRRSGALSLNHGMLSSGCTSASPCRLLNLNGRYTA